MNKPNSTLHQIGFGLMYLCYFELIFHYRNRIEAYFVKSLQLVTFSDANCVSTRLKNPGKWMCMKSWLWLLKLSIKGISILRYSLHAGLFKKKKKSQLMNISCYHVHKLVLSSFIRQGATTRQSSSTNASFSGQRWSVVMGWSS